MEPGIFARIQASGESGASNLTLECTDDKVKFNRRGNDSSVEKVDITNISDGDLIAQQNGNVKDQTPLYGSPKSSSFPEPRRRHAASSQESPPRSYPRTVQRGAASARMQPAAPVEPTTVGALAEVDITALGRRVVTEREERDREEPKRSAAREDRSIAYVVEGIVDTVHKGPVSREQLEAATGCKRRRISSVISIFKAVGLATETASKKTEIRSTKPRRTTVQTHHMIGWNRDQEEVIRHLPLFTTKHNQLKMWIYYLNIFLTDMRNRLAKRSERTSLEPEEPPACPMSDDVLETLWMPAYPGLKRGHLRPDILSLATRPAEAGGAAASPDRHDGGDRRARGARIVLGKIASSPTVGSGSARTPLTAAHHAHPFATFGSLSSSTMYSPHRGIGFSPPDGGRASSSQRDVFSSPHEAPHHDASAAGAGSVIPSSLYPSFHARHKRLPFPETPYTPTQALLGAAGAGATVRSGPAGMDSAESSPLRRGAGAASDGRRLFGSRQRLSMTGGPLVAAGAGDGSGARGAAAAPAEAPRRAPAAEAAPDDAEPAAGPYAAAAAFGGVGAAAAEAAAQRSGRPHDAPSGGEAPAAAGADAGSGGGGGPEGGHEHVYATPPRPKRARVGLAHHHGPPFSPPEGAQLSFDDLFASGGSVSSKMSHRFQAPPLAQDDSTSSAAEKASKENEEKGMT